MRNACARGIVMAKHIDLLNQSVIQTERISMVHIKQNDVNFQKFQISPTALFEMFMC